MEDNHLERFDEIAKEMCELHRAKDADYGNSFGETFRKLGIISAVTRISDKYNRLVNLSTNRGEANVDESLEDTLKDMAAYAIMTIVELENQNQEIVDSLGSVLKDGSFLVPGKKYKCKRSLKNDYEYEALTAGKYYEAITESCIKDNAGGTYITKKTFEEHFEH